MSGPAEPVFDAVVAPSLLDGLLKGVPEEPVVPPTPLGSGAATGSPPPSELAAIDCASSCAQGCIRPEACPNAEARARVEALLGSRSLDELVEIAANTAETRGRDRLLRDLGQGD
jgi:diaminopimelate epimerase